MHISYLLASGVDTPILLTCILSVYPYETLNQVAKHSLPLSHMLSSTLLAPQERGPITCLSCSSVCLRASRRGSGKGLGVQKGSLTYFILSGKG